MEYAEDAQDLAEDAQDLAMDVQQNYNSTIGYAVDAFGLE